MTLAGAPSRVTPARRAAHPIRIERDLAAFADIWPSAAQPGEGAHYVFQSREVLEIWLETIGAARKVTPAFVRVDREDGAPLMLLPLGIERRRGARVLTFLDGGVCDYNAPIVFPGAAAIGAAQMQAIFAALCARLGPLDAIVMEKAPARVGRALNPLRFLAVAQSPPSGHVLPLQGDYAGYVKTRLHRPKDSRRKRRRLEEAGPVRLIVARTADERERLFAAMVRQKRRRYLARDGVDGFDRPGYRAYFQTMTERQFDSGLVTLAGLEVGGVLLATHWGLIAQERFYCLMLGFEDHPLAQYSPGRILLEELIAWSYARGLSAFDLGCGDAPWKPLLGAEALPLAHHEAAQSPYGWAYLHAARAWRRMSAPRPAAAAD